MHKGCGGYRSAVSFPLEKKCEGELK